MTDDQKKPPPPRPKWPRPVEPFRNLTEPAIERDLATRLDEVLASHREILATQRKLALQLDGHGNLVNQRFDVFHEELAMLRATVLADHEPRLGQVEQTLGVKAGKAGGIVALLVVVLPLLADALPKYRHVFEVVGGLFQ